MTRPPIGLCGSSSFCWHHHSHFINRSTSSMEGNAYSETEAVDRDQIGPSDSPAEGFGTSELPSGAPDVPVQAAVTPPAGHPESDTGSSSGHSSASSPASTSGYMADVDEYAQGGNVCDHRAHATAHPPTADKFTSDHTIPELIVAWYLGCQRRLIPSCLPLQIVCALFSPAGWWYGDLVWAWVSWLLWIKPNYNAGAAGGADGGGR